jgi:sec-independent protein translocase protein TatC
MSERDISPDHELSDDAPTPQPIPRAGMGIADKIGFTAPEAQTEYFAPETQAEPAAEVMPSEAAPADEAWPDLATVPELAPLATADEPMIASRPLDEFDITDASAHHDALEKYSHSGGNGGGDDGNHTENLGGDDFSGSGLAQDLFAHLGELRARILYSVLAIALASCVTWNYGNAISEFLARPIRKTLDLHGVGSKLVTLDPTEGFYIFFQISLASAIILAAPFVLFQMWRFIEPALTRTERRYTLVLVPFSTLLFVAGVVLGYIMSPIFFQFFLQFQPPGSTATFSYGKSVALLAKMLLVFGVCFQVPVITIFLNKIGLVTRNFLIEYWRHAVVVIFLIVAIITPTWDPLTLCVCATPPCLFYVLSIWLVKWL